MKTMLAVTFLVFAAATAAKAGDQAAAADQSYKEELAQEKALKEGKSWTK
jgi:hypothetical protein